MSKHDTEYIRQRQRARGTPKREPFSAAKYIKRGLELRDLEQLPWPKVFGNRASISERRDNVCPCGCRKEHRNNVSQTIRSPYGHSFNVIYFWSNTCKNKWNREGMGSQTVGSHSDKHKKTL
jgi:hypothetical protein